MDRPVTIVTGSSRGIGEATARHLARQGHVVIGIGRNRPAEPPGPFFTTDLGDPQATVEALREITSRFEVDNLVNNAAVSHSQPLAETTIENLDEHWAVNLRAAVQFAQACLPGMQARRRGRIVNISSRAILGKSVRTSYSAAKAGLIGLTRCWAVELAPSGITVNAIAPGPVETDLFTRNHPPGSREREAMMQAVPMGRFASPEEIAAPIAFLLSDGAGFMTGQVLYVCGGSSCGSGPV